MSPNDVILSPLQIAQINGVDFQPRETKSVRNGRKFELTKLKTTDSYKWLKEKEKKQNKTNKGLIQGKWVWVENCEEFEIIVLKFAGPAVFYFSSNACNL